MADKPMKVRAMVVCDAHPAAVMGELSRELAGHAVLQWTVSRLLEAKHIDGVTIVQDDPKTTQAIALPDAVDRITVETPLMDAERLRRMAGRKWAMTNWRGGLGGMTCYDEIFSPHALLEAAQRGRAEAVLVVGGHWMFVDPQLCDAVIARLNEKQPAAQLAFCQAPPGLAGCVVRRDLLENLAQSNQGIGPLLEYNPRHPQADAIGLDPCVPIDVKIRHARLRAIHDHARWKTRITHAISHLGDDAIHAPASEIVDALQAAEQHITEELPPQIDLELGTQRHARGKVVPLSHMTIDRPNMTMDMARKIFDQAAPAGDVAITFGAMGDALTHPQWREFVTEAKRAGVGAVALQTDLLVGDPPGTMDEVQADTLVEQIMQAELDALIIDLPADTAHTYEQLMGCDGLMSVWMLLEKLLNARLSRQSADAQEPVDVRPPSPAWVVPRLTKVHENVGELMGFFDRWMTYAGYAVITGPNDAASRVAGLPVIDMCPPQRYPCRQLQTRMTIRSDGHMGLCDQDWLAEHGFGHMEQISLAEAWTRQKRVLARHAVGDFSTAPLCEHCRAWYRH